MIMMIIITSLVFFFHLHEGLCVRSSKPSTTNYDMHGHSSQCFEGQSANTCAYGSKLCGGRNTEANYVYEVTLAGTYGPLE